MRNKKGQTVQAMPGLIIGLVLAAVILVLGLIMTQTLNDTISPVTYTVVNESLNPMADNVNLTVTTAGACDFGSFAPTGVWNLSSGAAINSSCYTTYPKVGNIISVDCGDNFNDTHWNITYNYGTGDEACIAANQTTAGLGTFADFWEIIVLAIVVAIVLGIIISVFGRKLR